MAQPVVLYQLYQLFFGCFLANDGLELHGCKYRYCMQSPSLSIFIKERKSRSILRARNSGCCILTDMENFKTANSEFLPFCKRNMECFITYL